MSISFKIELGQRLREVRDSMNLTQKQFCLFFGPVVRSVSTVSEYESGDRTPPLELFDLLAKKGVNLNWLFTGKGDMYLTGEGVYITPGASRKEVRMSHQIHRIVKEGNAEKIKTIEGLLNTFAPEESDTKD